MISRRLQPLQAGVDLLLGVIPDSDCRHRRIRWGASRGDQQSRGCRVRSEAPTAPLAAWRLLHVLLCRAGRPLQRALGPAPRQSQALPGPGGHRIVMSGNRLNLSSPQCPWHARAPLVDAAHRSRRTTRVRPARLAAAAIGRMTGLLTKGASHQQPHGLPPDLRNAGSGSSAIRPPGFGVHRPLSGSLRSFFSSVDLRVSVVLFFPVDLREASVVLFFPRNLRGSGCRSRLIGDSPSRLRCSPRLLACGCDLFH